AFFGRPRDEKAAHAVDHAHEAPPVMTAPLMVLAVGALGAGVAFYPYFLGHDYSEFWRGSLFTLPSNHIIEESHHSPLWVVALPSVAMAAGFALAYVSYIAAPWIPAWTIKNFGPIHAFLYHKWYFDELYDWLFVRPTRWLARTLWKVGDGAIIDGLGPDGVSARVIDITNRVIRLQTGYVYHYAFVMLLGVAILISYFAYLYLRGTF